MKKTILLCTILVPLLMLSCSDMIALLQARETRVSTFASGLDFVNRVCLDTNGNIYATESNSNRIMKISSNGTVTLFAGSGSSGYADGTGAAAVFNYPRGIAIDQNGNVFVADTGNCRIRKITPSGEVTTFAGNGANTLNNGTGTAASFHFPDGMCFDANGNLYVADWNNQAIRKISPSGLVTTFVGPSTGANLMVPHDVAIDKQGNIYVADTVNHLIKKFTPDGTMSVFAGSGSAGFIDGTSTSAAFNYPMGIVFDDEGQLYVADYYNNSIRKISTDGTVSTVAGNGTSGSIDGLGNSATFQDPIDIAIDKNGFLYITDSWNDKIRKIKLVSPLVQ